jgi:type I restriction enzyme S subunit
MAELYQLPDGWEWKKLDKLTEVNLGKTPSRSKSEYFLGDKVWLSIRDLKDSYVSDSNEKLTDEAIRDSNIKIVPKGTLLMSFKLTLGRTAFANCDLYTNEAIASLPIKDESVLNKYFLKYAIGVIDLEKEVDNAVKGKTLNKEKIKNLDIPLPPLEEQKRIVSKLDTLFEKIDKSISLHQKNIDEANVFMASVLNDVFVELKEKYEKFSINKIATIKGGKRVPKGYNLSEKITPYPYLRVTDFKDYGTICTKKMLYLTEEVYEQIKRYTITDEDLYITNVGNTIGKSGIIPSELNGANLTENAVKLVYKDKKNTSNKFMYYFTKSSIFLIQLESATMQMAVPKLAIMRLGEIEIPLPPLQTQQKVVAYLDEISQKLEKIKQLQKEKMAHLKALKASILDRAFRGEL